MSYQELSKYKADSPKLSRRAESRVSRRAQNHEPGRRAVINHVKADDYFVTLATIISLIQQLIADDLDTMRDIEVRNRDRLETLQALQEDLLFAQQRYRIVKR